MTMQELMMKKDNGRLKKIKRKKHLRWMDGLKKKGLK